MVDTREIGKAMGRARAFEGISQEWMASQAGCSQQYFSKVENGDTEPTIKLLHLYARETGHEELLWKAYGLDFDGLLRITEQATRYSMAQQMLQHA